MTARAVKQLDMFAIPDPVMTPEIDPLAERIVAAGLASNDYLLWLNQSLNIEAGDLPSRLFHWPVEFVRSDRAEGESRILLRHPNFASFPFVGEIESKVGVRPAWEALDEFGRDRGKNWRYFHAVDLLTDEHWRDLIVTRNFACDWSIMLGLCYHAQYGGLNNDNTRAVLHEIGSSEPADKSAAFLNSDRVTITNCQQGKFVGLDSRDHASIWGVVHGLESKKFKRDRNGYLRFSPDFLAEKETIGRAALREGEQ